MTRFRELNRVEKALTGCDVSELHWARDYAETRVNSAHDMHPPEMAKKVEETWGKILNEVKVVISNLEN